MPGSGFNRKRVNQRSGSSGVKKPAMSQQPSTPVASRPQPAPQAVRLLRKMWTQREETGDMVLKMGDNLDLMVHSSVLCGASPTLRNTIRLWKENEKSAAKITLTLPPKYDAKTVTMGIEQIYSGEIAGLELDMCEEILIFANDNYLDGLKDYIHQYLTSNHLNFLLIGTVITLVAFDNPREEYLLKIQNFIKNNFSRLIGNESLLKTAKVQKGKFIDLLFSNHGM